MVFRARIDCHLEGGHVGIHCNFDRKRPIRSVWAGGRRWRRRRWRQCKGITRQPGARKPREGRAHCCSARWIGRAKHWWHGPGSLFHGLAVMFTCVLLLSLSICAVVTPALFFGMPAGPHMHRLHADIGASLLRGCIEPHPGPLPCPELADSPMLEFMPTPEPGETSHGGTFHCQSNSSFDYSNDVQFAHSDFPSASSTSIHADASCASPTTPSQAAVPSPRSPTLASSLTAEPVVQPAVLNVPSVHRGRPS